MGLKLRIRFNFDISNRSDWMLARVKWLNPDLTDLLESLLGNRGHIMMFHVSPPAPGASLCLCVLFVCLGIIITYCHLFRFPLIYLLGVLLCGSTADA